MNLAEQHRISDPDELIVGQRYRWQVLKAAGTLRIDSGEFKSLSIGDRKRLLVSFEVSPGVIVSYRWLDLWAVWRT